MDASFAASYFLPDEILPPGDTDRLEAATAFPAPSLLWAAFRNILVVKVRRKAMRIGEAGGILAAFGRLPIDDDTDPDGERTTSLAHAHALSVYDALCLEVAPRRGAGLPTLDRRRAAAAAGRAIPASS